MRCETAAASNSIHVNTNGSGHDGYSGKVIPAKHADHFRSLGYDVKLTNALESIDFDAIDKAAFSFVILDELDSPDGGCCWVSQR